MSSSNVPAAGAVAGYPLNPTLVIVPAILFAAVLGCDALFWQTESARWATAALWLLGAGVLVFLATCAFGLIEALRDASIWRLPKVGTYVCGIVTVLSIAVANFVVRYIEGADGILPVGFELSFFAVLVLLPAISTGWTMRRGAQD